MTHRPQTSTQHLRMLHNKNDVRISIVMGMYNCESTIGNAIKSVVNQTFTQWELIMCDDASTDNTLKIAETFLLQYPDKIKLLRNTDNKRLAFTLNRCLELAQGKYIARMDADDCSLPQRLETQFNYLENHPEIDCVGTSRYVDDGTGAISIRDAREEVSPSLLLNGVPFAHPTILIKRSVMKELGGYTVSKETQRAEDLDLWFRFFAAGYKGANIKEPLYLYRETKADYKKRTISAALGTAFVFAKGYKLLNIPIHQRWRCLRPILSALLPTKFMYWYHKIKDKPSVKNDV